MSVHITERRTGPAAYDVRWRGPVDRANYSRRFEDAREAEAFDAAMKAKLALDRAKAAWAEIPDHWREAVDSELTAGVAA